MRYCLSLDENRSIQRRLSLTGPESFRVFIVPQIKVDNSHLDWKMRKIVGYLINFRVSVRAVESLGGNFATLYAGDLIFKSWKKIIIFQKEKGNTYTLLIVFIVKSLQKERKGTNLLLWPPIYWNKRATTPKWISSQETNFTIPLNKLPCFFLEMEIEK